MRKISIVQSLIPSDIIHRSDEILFITHLALGDFTYLQNCFQAFSQVFPHIKIHIWVDEVRRTRKVAAWPFLKKYALYDWLDECSFISKVYHRTYSPKVFKQSITEARQQHYPLVVSLSTLRPPMYIMLARQISPRGFVVGIRKPIGMFALHKRLAYCKLNIALNLDRDVQSGMHISDVYADWFQRLFDIMIKPMFRFPFVDIPPRWRRAAQDQLREWGFGYQEVSSSNKRLFINPYAKNNKRCWPLERVIELVITLSRLEVWRNAHFIINVVPEEIGNAKKFFAQYPMQQVRLFSAQENFFQLPAMLHECDLVVSVETAVMHLANAVRVPVVALMRQKNLEWAPIDQKHSTVVTTNNFRDLVKEITVMQVVEALEEQLINLPKAEN